MECSIKKKLLQRKWSFTLNLDLLVVSVLTSFLSMVQNFIPKNGELASLTCVNEANDPVVKGPFGAHIPFYFTVDSHFVMKFKILTQVSV